MCGITGLVAVDGRPLGNAAEVARAMALTLVHRGPDDAGSWASPDGVAGLAHRRLSIIDLSPLGRNPMAWDGGRLQITFNGEIYNFLELRNELERKGYRFRSQTDTEVILAAYDQWNVDCVSRLAGMFAFALWDEPRRRLWLVRDRLGKKPLYYSVWNSVLWFGSELKALTAGDGFPRDVDPAALRFYLRYGYVPSPHTIYRHARKLPPAHHLILERGQLTIARYWDPVSFANDPIRLSDADAESELEARLAQAVRQRRIADVPLGAFLSGGIDSSLVAALMQEQSVERVKTFSIRFENPEFNEADHAARVAAHLRTDHHEQSCTDRELLETVDRLPEMFDEPFADSSAVPTYLVSRIARRHVTVALSGDGGDELFFGYPRYRYHASGAWVLSLPRPLLRAGARVASGLPTRRLRRIADVLRNDENDRYGSFVTWWSQADVIALTGEPAQVPTFYADARARANLSSIEQPLLLDLVSYLPEDILTKVDRTSMAVSLEVRAPLLDHRVVEFALRLPLRLKRRGGVSKWILRRMLHKRVPPALVERPKMGFGVPLSDFFRGPLRQQTDEFLRASNLEDLGIDPRPVQALWIDFLGGRRHRVDLLWQIHMLIGWSRRFRSGTGQAKLASAAMSR
jgi:asparagine synthase (glutamine-hydrolysing)